MILWRIMPTYLQLLFEIREFEKLKTVLELYNMEIHQKNAGPDNHRFEDNGKKKYRAESTK